MPTKASIETLKTWATAAPPESGAISTGSPAALRNDGRFASIGLGMTFSITSASSATPAPVSADAKHTGMRWPSRNAFSNASWSLSASSASPSR